MDKINRRVIRRFKHDLQVERDDLRKEKDRCSRLRKENLELYEKVKNWEEKNKEEVNRKIKRMEEVEEENRIARMRRSRKKNVFVKRTSK